MPAIFFTNLALLGGLAALTIPILVHLLIKRKKQRLRFSTNQFFVKQDEQASRRRKLRNWLLLTLRLLLVTLLVLAFARPFTRLASVAGPQMKRLGVFVLDRSVSMQAAVQGVTAWNRALNSARAALREFKAEDQAAIVTCSARSETFSGWKPAPAISRLLDGLAPENTSGDLADGLRTAMKLASTRDEGAAATIYIVSDLQRNSCQDLSTVTVPANIEVKLLNGGGLFAPNMAIADLRLQGQVNPQAQITLQNSSDEDRADVQLSLLIDDKEVLHTSVPLKAGLATNLVLALPAFKPGWHRAEARLLAKDTLPADDARYHAFFIPESLRILCVETKSGARLHEQDSFFVASALQPEAEPGTSIPALFTVEITDPPALAGKLASARDSSRPSGYAAVVLPALRQIPGNATEALTTYVRNGGGLLLFLGDGVSANRYNAEFRDLLPWPLASVESCPSVASGWHLDTFEDNSPMFAAFRGPATPTLRIPEFTRRFRFSPTAPAAGGSTLATFDDALPLISSRTVGAGRVVLMNTSADASWSDWPKRKSFLPWLHGTIYFLAGRSSMEAMQPSRLFTTGEDVEITLGQSWKKRSLVLQRMGANGASVMTDAEGRLPSVHLETPGVYVVRDSKGVELQGWAVNLPSRESDLTTLSPQAFQKQLVRAKEPRPVTLQASLFGAGNGEKEWWRVLLLAALCLLFAEVFLANRTRV